MKPPSGHPQQMVLNGAQFKPTDKHRWPRGYTPERMDEVRKATDGSIRRSGGDGASAQPFGHREKGVPFSARKRTVQDVLARSTVPVEQMDSSIYVGQQPGSRSGVQGVQFGSRAKGSSVIEVYDKRERLKKDRKRSQEQESWDHTLMHEMGHHVSDMPTAVYRSRTGKKAEENFAESFATEHGRRDPRVARRVAYNPDYQLQHKKPTPQKWSDMNPKPAMGSRRQPTLAGMKQFSWGHLNPQQFGR